MSVRRNGDVAELADAQDLKSCGRIIRAGSIPAISTKKNNYSKAMVVYFCIQWKESKRRLPSTNIAKQCTFGTRPQKCIIYSHLIQNTNNIALSSLVPVIGFTLSTLSLKLISKMWEKNKTTKE